ncbi:MAG: proprotein convertase P-domain-containing protein [Bdellovibrionales bacterium]|nr:proprotein convertase P-domain-containing protein [Bdellovibrionales bacterium]
MLVTLVASNGYSIPESRSLGEDHRASDRKAVIAEGTASVFESDPRTMLQTLDLNDDSPAEDFEGAYKEVVLPEVEFDGSVYRLENKWVKIADLEAPTESPIESSDGSWNFKRGESGFNDVMAFYHLDKNFRYLESIGYKDEKTIPNFPITVDTNGWEGRRGAYLDPVTRQIVLGRGCIDVGEDPDELNHLFFKTVAYGLNPTWGGADVGVIIEGFADYWAGSRGLSSPNGSQFMPNDLFLWSGHGACWLGRKLNAVETHYDKSKTYKVHQKITGGFAEELWSTPIFQSQLILLAQGKPASDMDQIVIESIRGASSKLSMRAMALRMLDVATQLFPGGPHRSILEGQFNKRLILEVPQAELTLATVEFAVSGGGDPQPGKEVTVNFSLLNSGDGAAQNVKVVLVSDNPDINVTVDTAQVGEIAAGDQKSSSNQLKFKVGKGFPCGQNFQLKLKVTYEDFDNHSVDFFAGAMVGTLQSLMVANDTEVEIPDNQSPGAESDIEVGADLVPGLKLEVFIDIRHTYIGDLRIDLTHPSGQVIRLWNASGGQSDDIIGVFPTTLHPYQSLDPLKLKSSKGNWKMNVTDIAGGDIGVLKKWELRLEGLVCK